MINRFTIEEIVWIFSRTATTWALTKHKIPKVHQDLVTPFIVTLAITLKNYDMHKRSEGKLLKEAIEQHIAKVWERCMDSDLGLISPHELNAFSEEEAQINMGYMLDEISPNDKLDNDDICELRRCVRDGFIAKRDGDAKSLATIRKRVLEIQKKAEGQ